MISFANIPVQSIRGAVDNAGADGRWITTDNGVHLFIREGEDVHDSIARLQHKTATYKDLGGDYQGGHTWGKANYTEWRDNLSSAELKAFGHYTTPYYRQINGELRGFGFDPSKFTWGTPLTKSELESTIGHLDDALHKGSLPENMTTFRGIRGDVLPKDLKVGGILSDKAFTSSSTSKKYASDWIEKQGGPESTLATIRLPKDSPGAYLDHVPGAAGYEREFLMPRDTRFSVQSISTVTIGGKNYRHVELLMLPEKKGK